MFAGIAIHPPDVPGRMAPGHGDPGRVHGSGWPGLQASAVITRAASLPPNPSDVEIPHRTR